MNRLRHPNQLLFAAALIALSVTVPVSAPAQELARYNLGAVPDQTVWSGSAREFLLHWDDSAGVAMTFAAAPEPEGSIQLAPAGGNDWHFQYTPAPGDKTAFQVTVTATGGGGSTSQSWQMAPQPVLPPETDYFRSGPHTQAPVNKYDLEVVDMVDAVPASLNYETQDLRSVQVIGETVEIEEDHPGNNLFEAYCDGTRRDIRAIEIIADRVVVRSPLRLKQTDVTIWARELVFEGDGSITTTPEELPAKEGTSVSGEDGLPAGDVTLNVGEIIAEGGGTRFDLTGGRGQAGGPGAHGQDGSSVTAGWSSVEQCDSGSCKKHNAAGGGAIIYYSTTIVVQVREGGTKNGKPTSGDPAKASGKPGEGGDAGSITSTVPLGGLASVAGGLTPPPTYPTTFPTSYYKGGSAGTPTRWEKVRFWFDFNPFSWGMKSETTESDTTSAGADKAAVAGDTVAGAAGAESVMPSAYGWLHPLAVRKALQHIRDDYLGERIAAAQERIASYVDAITAYQADPDWADADPDHQSDLSAMREEMIVLQQQMEAGLDYFGNPAAWVPMLSFEVNQTLFQNELDRAMNTLYLSYWIGNKAADETERFNALNELRDAVADQLEQAKTDYEIAVARLPVLNQRANQIDSEVQTLQNDLEAEEIKLLNDTREEDWVTGLRIGLKVAATMCQMIPVYQPALGAVGEGLRVASNFNPDRPWDSITDAKNIGTAYTSSPFYEAAGEKKDESDKVDSDEAKADKNKSKDYAKGLLQAGQGLAAGIKDYQEFVKEREAPSEEMLAELERLKSRSPEYKALMERVEELMEENRELADEIIDTMQKIGALSGLMTNSLLALDALGRDIAEGVVLDERAASYLDDLERKALDRLVKYHYYLAKAYEYRLLLPYTEPLDLSALFDKFEEIAGINNDHAVTPEQFDSFKAVYQEMLSSVAETIFDHYNANRPDLSVPVRFNLLEDEVATLNAGGTVSLNLREAGFFQPEEENVRIVDLSLFSLEAAPEGGGPLGRTAFVDLKIEHSGESLLKQGGETYLFRHYNRNTDNPFVWGGRYDAIDDRIDPIRPSDASDSLLRSLLSGAAVTDMLLYSRPSAWADLRISRTYVNSGGPPIEISAVRLEMVYDFTPRAASSRQRDLEVFVRTLADGPGGTMVAEESSFQPYFELGSPDTNGRADARGGFLRVYDSAAGAVSVSAPARYGLWEFAGWTDAFGRDLPGGPHLDPTFLAPLPDDTVLVALYREAGEIEVLPLWLEAPVFDAGQLGLVWQGEPGVRLQFRESLETGSWEDVPGSEGQSSVVLPAEGDTGFFRLAR